MTDLLLCELLGTKPQFVSALAERLGFEETGEVSSIRRSVHDTSLGETDVEAILKTGKNTLGLLVENKVRAVLMPDQIGRYRRRGEDGLIRGLWDQYFVVVFSPESYRSYMSEKDAAAADGFLSYEWVRDWLQSEDALLNAFKIHMLAEAINDARVGYVKKLDTRMTSFHQSVYAIAHEEYPQLKMAWLEQAGFDSSIIHLPHALPARGDSLVMKVKMGTVELRVETRDPIAAERALSATVPQGWRTTRAKGYAGVEIAVEVLDPTLDFHVNESLVRRYLGSLKELYDFYHRREVSELIEVNRGIRSQRGKVSA
ncbi:PD-(D/E)XK nuclease family protein [Rhizobium laguerreae]|uniref:PD-(D/E)XK nuclease family protein n=1 Tax=Rhizobium laguerreae TaxID=1076926 RepID=UPI001C915754|nr:PD-(D/E)XK nuclease family protein [Rhizobium laguerreae]MBY3211488.1 PD-(D/E)XK nuclease family protein [Rhizobium laguerreae]